MRRSLAALALAMVLPLPGLTDVVVKPGETLSEIAERHGVSLNRLMQANGINNANLVVAGQRLVLPGASRTGSRAAGGTITVQPGETLSEIAERQGVSLTRLMQDNGIRNPNQVVAGQKLLLQGSGSSSGGSSAGRRSLPTAPYTVKSGETLSEIADRFDTSTERLIQLNRISNPNLLVAGTRLAIPGRPSSSRSASPTATAPRNAKEHVVRSGESLSSIADSYGVPMQRLISINKITDPDLVVSGTRLKLQAPPPVRTASAKPTRQVASATPKPASPKPATVASSPATTTPRSTPAARTTATPTATVATAPRESTPTEAATTTATPTTASPTTTAAATTTTAASTTTTRPTASTTRTTSSSASSAKPQGPEWRSYGPLQVDWANWQPMGGSYVAPTLNGDGKPVYLAVNCGARKLNATSQSGQWKSWDAPQTDFEEQLISDICKARGS